MRFRYSGRSMGSGGARVDAAMRAGVPEDAVIRLPPPRPAPRLGRILLARGALSRAQLSRGLRLQRLNGGRLGDILTANGLTRRWQVDAALAEQARMPLADLEAEPISSDVGAAADLDKYLTLGVAPWRRLGGRVIWLTADPASAPQALAELGADLTDEVEL